MNAQVFKYNTDKHMWELLHAGTITGETTTHYRVSNPGKSGQPPCEFEFFAKRSKMIKCEISE